jgi:CTP:molybdopterin cytidylyltransferase MocA
MVPAVVLAAGKSTRMGRTKALLPLGGADTFLTRIVRSFRDAGVEDVIVVLGHDAEAIASALADRRAAARIVVNAAYERGQLSSVLTGLQVVDRPGVAGMLLTLVDVPLVSAETIRAVVAHHRVTAAPIVRPVSGVRHGHPVLIDRRLFDALRRADPQHGAKPVIRAYASAAGDVEVNDEGAFIDVDTPEEYAALTRFE